MYHVIPTRTIRFSSLMEDDTMTPPGQLSDPPFELGRKPDAQRVMLSALK